MLAVLPGDGIGPEVTAEAVRCLAAVAEIFQHDLHFEEAPFGGAALDASGEPLPTPTLALCKRAEAVLLGAIAARSGRECAPLRDRSKACSRCDARSECTQICVR